MLFAVPEHEYTFSRSLAAPMCLAQALTVTLASRLQQDSESPRIPVVTQSERGTAPTTGRKGHAGSVIGPSGTGIAPATAPQTD